VTAGLNERLFRSYNRAFFHPTARPVYPRGIAMPTYDYRCEANGQVYEVRHAMALRPRTWGELRVAGALAEDATIADDAPVTRLLTAAGVVSSRVLKNPEAPACARGGCAGNCR